MEELRQQINGSIYNLRDYGARTPLKDFWGDFEDFVPRAAEADRRARVLFRFTNVEVIETTGEPWPYLTAELDLPLSDQKGSMFGVLGETVKKFFPTGGISAAKGKRLHMKLTGGHMMWNRDAGKAEPREAWEIIEVKGLGVGGTTPQIDITSRVVQLAIGKTPEEFNSAALQDTVIRSNPTVLNSCLDGNLIPSLIAAGKLKKDANGRLTA